MTSRVGDFSHQNRLADLMSATRSRVRSQEMQVASGKSVQRFSEIPKDAGFLLRTREQLAVNNNFVEQNERLTDQLQAMDGALGAIVDVAERFRTLLVQRLNDPAGANVPLETEARAMTKEVAARLNLTSDGRFLFGGSRTDQRPVSLPASSINTSDPSIYYQGDVLTRGAWIDENVKIDLPARADDPAFAGLLAAMGKAALGHANNDQSALRTALTLTEQALAGVIDLRSRTGAVAARVGDVTESQRSAALYLDEGRARIEDTDIAKTMTQMAQDKVAIEASYLVVSQVSKLSLVDYLR